MKELEFAHVLMVGTGANMAIYVLRDTEEEDQVGLCKPLSINAAIFRRKWRSLTLWTKQTWSTLNKRWQFNLFLRFM